jgi:hypothetical protein
MTSIRKIEANKNNASRSTGLLFGLQYLNAD